MYVNGYGNKKKNKALEDEVPPFLSKGISNNGRRVVFVLLLGGSNSARVLFK